MARANLFVINAEAVIAHEPRGQAARVLQALREMPEPRLAVDIDTDIATSATPHKTRQDSLRVTLYYLVIFAKRGWALKVAQPSPVDAPAATDEVLEPGEELVSVDSESEPTIDDEMAAVVAAELEA